jgi:hypothetical protein
MTSGMAVLGDKRLQEKRRDRHKTGEKDVPPSEPRKHNSSTQHTHLSFVHLY